MVDDRAVTVNLTVDSTGPPNVPALSCGGECLLFGECLRDFPSVALQEALDQRVPVNLNAMLGCPR